MKKIFITCAIVSALTLTGCSSFLDYKSEIKTKAQKSYDQEQKWWLAFQDPLMDDLANNLLEQNIDLKIALTRVEEARALRRVAGSSLFPDISVGGNGSRGNKNIGLTQPETIAQTGFDAAWEIDIFGANRAALDASGARFEAAQQSALDVRRIITADLIRAVIEWRKAQQTLAETKDLLVAQSDQVSLFQSRLNAGLIDATFLERARAQHEQTATQIPISEAATKAAQYQIERLLGQAPESLSEKMNAFEKHNLSVPEPQKSLDIPFDALRDRPDVREARLRMVAVQADLREAEANLWPKISLSAFFGVEDTSKGLEAATAANPIWSLVGSFTAPLLNFGRLRGAVDAANASSQTTALEYENAVLLALQEAHTALSDYLNGANAVAQQSIALKHRQETVELARERFNRGLTDMTDLTTAQAELDQATISLINQKAAVAIAYIQLQKSLGI